MTTPVVPNRRMTQYDDVKAFHRAFEGLSRAGHKSVVPDKPVLPDPSTWAVRVRLITEEFAELARDYTFGDVTGFADGLVDLTWMVMGTAVVAGVPFNAVWDEVTRANMDKVRNGVLFDDSGKVLKPPGWRAPDVERIIREALER